MTPAKAAGRPGKKRTPTSGRPSDGKGRRSTLEPEVVEVPPVPAEEAPAGPRPDSGSSPSDELPGWVRKAIALFFLWAVGLLVAYWALNRLRPILLILLVALFVSLAMEPPVHALTNRGWSRGPATAFVTGVFLIATIGFFAAFGSVAFSQASQLVNNAPHYVRNIVSFLNRDFGTHIDANGLIHNLQSKNGAVQKFARNLAHDAPNVLLTIGTGLLEIVLTLVFAFYMTADGPRLRRTICSRLPRRHQEIVLDTWEIAVQKTGAYLYSRLLQAMICTVAVWAFLFILGIPASLALAIWVGVVSQFVPVVGTYIALVLPALVALVYNPVDAIWVVAYLVGYQQIENYFLGPRIARFTLKIHPAVTIGSVFAGALLLGPVGALLALPTAAVVQALLSTYTEEQEVIESELTAEDQRRERRFRISRFSLTRRPERGSAPAPTAAGDTPAASRDARAARRTPRRRS